MDVEDYNCSLPGNKEIVPVEPGSCNSGSELDSFHSASLCAPEGYSKSRLSLRMRDVENLNSDSEDDLPSYGFNWTPDSRKASSKSEDRMDTLNVDEILSRRKKDKEMFAQVHELDDILKGKMKLNANSENLNVMKTSDEDVKYILESAKLMEVVEPTVKTEPHYLLINSEVSMLIFNFQTIKFEHFIPQNNSKYQKLCNVNFNAALANKSLHVIQCSERTEAALCTFSLYLMSVHPVHDMAEMCYDLLCNRSQFCPSLSDFINIFRNWGYELKVLYRVVPNLYTGLHKGINFEGPKLTMEVKEHNFCFVFQYLKHLLIFHSNHTFCNLMEPLMRMIFDVKIYDNHLLRTMVSQILVFLSCPNVNSSNVLASKSITVRDIHLKDLPLQQQTVICTKILRGTAFAIPLGYAALQQFLGCSNIAYCQHIKLEEVYNMLVRSKNIVEESSFLDIFCSLQIIEMLLCQKTNFGGEVCEQVINHENWHDLFHVWSLCVCSSDNCADPIYVKEKIAQVQYQLRMRHAITARHQQTQDFRKKFN